MLLYWYQGLPPGYGAASEPYLLVLSFLGRSRGWVNPLAFRRGLFEIRFSCRRYWIVSCSWRRSQLRRTARIRCKGITDELTSSDRRPYFQTVRARWSTKPVPDEAGYFAAVTAEGTDWRLIDRS